jgi:inner membrane protein
MDNLCHTLVGAAMSEAGLRRRTRLAGPVLMIANNLPDLDVLVFATGTSALAFRRGWTHGILAQALLPLLLTAVVVMVDRVRTRRHDGEERLPLSVPWLLAFSYAGVLAHVFLDYLNTYGVRLLAPFDWRWFYGDAVFIIDLALWVSLGLGVWATRRWGRELPARAALTFAACYIAVMLVAARASRDLVIEAWQIAWRTRPAAVMVGPLPVTPLDRTVIVDDGGRYAVGTFSWMSSSLSLRPETVPRNDEAPEVARAREAPEVRGFLVWSRFPYWTVEPHPDGVRVTVRDMRFGDRFAAATVVPRATASASPGSAHPAGRARWPTVSRAVATSPSR